MLGNGLFVSLHSVSQVLHLSTFIYIYENSKMRYDVFTKYICSRNRYNETVVYNANFFLFSYTEQKWKCYTTIFYILWKVLDKNIY